MAKSSKFNAFSGVFTPSILTILGVIMYLRLPRVVGSAGLYATLGIILVAHVISVATGLSISSIATDKRVGAGGPYYVLSRSLGLPLGGTIGLALFIGLSFSISLYVIGFSESFLAYIGKEATPSWIRIVGTSTVVLLTIITFVSTSLAIKTQYLILALIGLSLISIFAGGNTPPASPTLQPAADAPPLSLLFGIFFPAVTGFTAGVNMSGDLKDPKRSIPIGTILAIAAGLLVYLGLAVFLGFQVPAEALRDDPEVLIHVAWFPPLVIAGIWGATLSSALGSILGAPRILQSMSSDRVTPTLFAKGYGPTNEPRNALVLAFLVGEAGILIAELDIIARVVSMVFLAMYGFLNVACAIENWSSPDFRPSFRIPTWVSVIGAGTCLIVMIQLDLLAMAGSMLLMLGLYAYLQRRRLALHSGDAWEGVWSSLVRSGLHRLSRVAPQAHNWKPNILTFFRDAPTHSEVHSLTSALVSGAGVATEFHLGAEQSGSLPDWMGEQPSPGIFHRHAPGEDPFQSIELLAAHYGFSGMQPDTLMLPLSISQAHPDRLDALLSGLQPEQNLLLARSTENELSEARIDVWWTLHSGNLPFSVALTRFLSRSGTFRTASVRFLILTRESSMDEVLALQARRYLREARLEADIRLVHAPLSMTNPFEVIREESESAALVIAGLVDAHTNDRGALHAGLELAGRLRGHLLLYRAGKRFPEVLRGAIARVSLPPDQPVGRGTEAMEELRLPAPPALGQVVQALDTRVQELLTGRHQSTLAQLYRANRQLVESVQEHAAEAEQKALDLLASPGNKRPELSQIFADLRGQVALLLRKFCQETLTKQLELLEADISELLRSSSWVSAPERPHLKVARPLSDFVYAATDTPIVRSIKRSAKWRGRLGWSKYRYKVPVAQLERYYHDRFCTQLVAEQLHAFLEDCQQLALELSKALNRPPRDLAVARAVAGSDAELEGTGEYFAELGRVCQVLCERSNQQIEHYRQLAPIRGRRLALDFAQDIDRLDAARFIRRERRSKWNDEAALSAFSERLSLFEERQRLRLERAALGQQLGSAVEAVARLTLSMRDEVLLGSAAACLRECERLGSLLRKLKSGEGDSSSSFEPLTQNAQLETEKPQILLERLSVDFTRAIANIPESVETVGDEDVLDPNTSGEVERVEIKLRRGLDVAISRELLSPLQERLRTYRHAQRAAWSVISDISQLLSFQSSNAPEELPGLAERSFERLQTAQQSLTGARDAVRELISRGLEKVAATANVNRLETIQEQLQREELYNRARAAERGAKSVLWRARRALSRFLTELLYRRSSGVLAARRLGSTRRATASAELRMLVEETQPGPGVSEALPQFYRQLFAGQAAVGGSFQVARERQQAALEEAVRRFRQSTSGGALLVVGEPGSGKTTLIQELLERLDPKQVVRVPAPDGGSSSLDQFRRTLGIMGPPRRAFSRFRDSTAIVIDDLELWWERREAGLDVVEFLLEAAREHGRRLIFVLSTSTYAHDLLERLLPLSSSAASVLRCEPFSADELRQAVLRRHQSTGLTFELGSAVEEDMSQWSVARLFTRYFDYSAGNVGAAFHAWLSHIEQSDGKSIRIRLPKERDWDALDEMDGDAKALLLQLILHKHASRQRLSRIFGRDEIEIERLIRDMLGVSLLSDLGNGSVSLNESIRHQVGTHFLKRGLL